MIKNQVKMYKYVRENQLGGKVFDMKMSEMDEMTFMQQFVGGVPNQ